MGQNDLACFVTTVQRSIKPSKLLYLQCNIRSLHLCAGAVHWHFGNRTVRSWIRKLRISLIHFLLIDDIYIKISVSKIRQHKRITRMTERDPSDKEIGKEEEKEEVEEGF
jgi:hypothetical protein